MSQNLVETCPLASSQLLKPLPTRPQNPLGKICVKCVSAVFNPCRVAGTTFNALLLLWARWRPRTCVVGRSGCARARQSHCAWPASYAFLSAHAPPPHKLLSSSGARRLQLISWVFQFFTLQYAMCSDSIGKSIIVPWLGSILWMKIAKWHHMHALSQTFADFESNLAAVIIEWFCWSDEWVG